MDSRQREAERRRFLRIGLAFVIGLFFIAFTVGLQWIGAEESTRTVRQWPTWLGYVFGAGWIGAGLYELARRLVSGPTQPGKRAR